MKNSTLRVYLFATVKGKGGGTISVYQGLHFYEKDRVIRNLQMKTALELNLICSKIKNFLLFHKCKICPLLIKPHKKVLYKNGTRAFHLWMEIQNDTKSQSSQRTSTFVILKTNQVIRHCTSHLLGWFLFHV